MPPVFRFAPTPNGYLHLGHALSALINAELAARCEGGIFVLRIEDLDPTRCKPQYEAAIYEDLAWLGLTWPQPVRRQSEHFTEYSAALDQLAAQGLVYRSFESRGDIARIVAASTSPDTWPRDPDGAPLFPGAALAPDDEARLEQGAPFAWRLDMDKAIARTGPLTWTERGHTHEVGRGVVAAEPEAWGDVILARKETPTSYHLSVVIDDALQGVTDVVRGADLFPSTAVHRVLQTLLGLPELHYSHHPVILGDDGKKLSKSAGAPSLRDLRAQGATPADIRRMVGL